MPAHYNLRITRLGFNLTLLKWCLFFFLEPSLKTLNSIKHPSPNPQRNIKSQHTKTKIMAFDPITSWQIDGGKWKQ